ncbi:MAG: methyltransferase domain-containing protein, partial [Bacteroidota bacterium]
MEERYDHIGKGYNDTRKADPYLLSRMEVLLDLKKDGHYLDIGSGTGNYTIALNNKGYSFTGIEPAVTMIEKAKGASKSIIWKRASAEAIPLTDAAVDGVMAIFTIHHWANLSKGFLEVARVLKPGGRLLILTD